MSRPLDLNPARIRALGGGGAAVPDGSPHGHAPHRGPYRDDLPELYRGQPWTVNLLLLNDPNAIDEVKRAANYVEPEGSGRWGTAQRRLIAEVAAEARGVAAPGALGRECGLCVHYRTDQPGVFDRRAPGACAKLRAIAFAYASCGLFRGVGQPEAAGAPAAAAEVAAVVQPSGDMLDESRPGFEPVEGLLGGKGRQKPMPSMAAAAAGEPNA